MSRVKQKVHFVDNELLNPTNPITVNLIGAGGTGSKVLTALVEMNHSLLALGHAGLHVRLWDDDTISEANLGRQRFAQSELGLHKSVALINRANRWAGTRWRAETIKYGLECINDDCNHVSGTLTISCVDTVHARFEIAEILRKVVGSGAYNNRPKYWLDFGNGLNTGQVLLSTVGEIVQPKSEQFDTVATLPFVTDEFGELLRQSERLDDTPSCSVADALQTQDLYINSALAQMGISLLWSLLRQGMTAHRGLFLNLGDFRAQPIAFR
ncbi:PRTRC system ThiF family protein [Sphingobacterium oryzagri]|uniref:PRTRC system ThiF family protein n=1 Tax=Sphingobacterium oryzagri TaxID=3025669 RepID=A0ABY7WHM2_9SPHI|nr:PRTRC system ThiF family protein [Sphingobacterium sp. KACC 22765]WDF66899.1 PRTRC system ThiF family protein [Sphingobacterium sp. KACC 22765]